VSSLPDTVQPRVFDLWIALLAGERIWHDGPIQAGPRERISAGFALVGTVCTVAAIWVAVGARFDPWDPDVITTRRATLLAFMIAATLAAVPLAMRYQHILRGREAIGRPFWFEVTWRSIAFLLLTAVIAGALPRAHTPGVVPLGVLAGADASLTLWALGVTPQARAWVRRFVGGPVHLGAVGALLAVAAFGESIPTLRTLIGLYAAMWVGLIVAGLTVVMINRLGLAVDQRVAEEVHDSVASERARRAHWLHDDVLSEVHLATLRISSKTATPEQINDELLDLDHRLRLRQLDDMLSADTLRIFEVLQPHLRRAQNLGVRLEHVPTHEVTRLEVDEQCGRLLNRAVSLFMSNAINAGATRLSLDVHVVDGGERIVVSVTDDAGGFDLATVPDGRGLSTLIDELGADAVQRHDAPGGSTMTATIPRHHSDESHDPVDHHSDEPHARSHDPLETI
jgi:hypothetical protein